MYDILVIGGGPAGVTAALRARELGAKVALVERNRLGGTCTNDGCVPTRVLAHAARLIRESDQFYGYGLIGDKPELDFGRLMARVQQVVYQIHEKKQLIGHLHSAGVDVLTEVGDAVFADPHRMLLPDGRSLEAEKFIISVGGRARRLNFPGAEYALTHHDVWSMTRLPRSIAIVGGAATGCQVGSIFAAFGVQVTIFEVSPRILRLEDEAISTVVADAFRQRGIGLVTGFQSVERIDKTATGLSLVYKQNDELHALETEAVVIAAGWPGNADALNLEAAGVKSERGYIQVNDYMQTAAPHIFAAGDITGRMMLVQSAGYEGRAAAENAVLGIGERNRHHIVPHGGFTDPEYASVGLTEEQAQNYPGGAVTATVGYDEMDRAVIDDHTVGVCKLIVSQETHRILGAHIAGEQALEIVQVVAAGMASDMWVEQLAELEIAYPTYTAIIGLAARRIVREMGIMPLAAEWRTLGRIHLAEWERKDA